MKGNRKTRLFLDNCNTIVDAAYQDSITLKGEHQYLALKNTLEMLLEQQFGMGRVRVHFFGSRVVGLADAKSDLDIYVEIGKLIFIS
jgi:hypothetical protein